MELLITVSNQNSAPVLAPLLGACQRNHCRFEVFLTHTGVLTLNNEKVVEHLNASGDVAIACHDSWVRYGSGTDCPVTLGSQTNHSEMMARAERVISL